MSERTSEWPSTYEWILGCSGQLCTDRKKERKRNFRREEGKTKEKMRIETKKKSEKQTITPFQGLGRKRERGQ